MIIDPLQMYIDWPSLHNNQIPINDLQCVQVGTFGPQANWVIKLRVFGVKLGAL
jgi:hypothetical protein